MHAIPERLRDVSCRGAIQIDDLHLLPLPVVSAPVSRDALSDIFDLCDLTGNELWSREEFRLYNLLTSDQELDDAEWQVVEGSSLASLRIITMIITRLY